MYQTAQQIGMSIEGLLEITLFKLELLMSPLNLETTGLIQMSQFAHTAMRIVQYAQIILNQAVKPVSMDTI